MPSTAMNSPVRFRLWRPDSPGSPSLTRMISSVKLALVDQKANGLPRRRIGLVMQERGIPREGYPIFAGDREVGVVTSGTMSPSLKVGVALALVEPEAAREETELAVAIRNRRMGARVTRPPFVK